MARQQTRSSVFALVEETTQGVLRDPQAATDFTALREGFSFAGEVETVDTDELINDIGASKSFITKETPNGSVPKYFKHSGVEGQEPDYGLFVESAIGSKTVNATEYNTIAGSTAGTASARAVIKVDTGEGSFFKQGQALLIKDATNGYLIRNVYSISTDDLSLNFNIANAPAVGVNLGKAVHYSPAATGHKTFSAHIYGASSSAGYHQAQAGCRTTELSAAFTANELATIDISFEGIEFFYNPVQVTSSNNIIDFTDDGGAKVATLTAKAYKSIEAFRAEVESKMNAASINTITVTFSSSTGKYTISSNGIVFELDWATGPNTANTAAALLGFAVADETGATTYTSDNEQSYDPPFTPVYDSSTANVVRHNELILGDFDQYVCRSGSSFSVSIATPKTDADDFCAQSGVSESIILEREVTWSGTLYLNKHEIRDFDAFINNKTISVMFNHGPKDSAGNWKAGECVNVYCPNTSFTAYPVSDSDGLVVIEVEGKGFITSTQKDIHINMV